MIAKQLSHASQAMAARQTMPPSNVPIEGLQLGPLIGKGSFGRVYRARWHNKPVAVKVRPRLLMDVCCFGQYVQRGQPKKKWCGNCRAAVTAPPTCVMHPVVHLSNLLAVQGLDLASLICYSRCQLLPIE